MPTITVEGPPIREIERKRELVEKFTKAAVEIYGIDKKHITVVIKENPPENVGSGGQLIIDRRKK